MAFASWCISTSCCGRLLPFSSLTPWMRLFACCWSSSDWPVPWCLPSPDFALPTHFLPIAVSDECVDDGVCQNAGCYLQLVEIEDSTHLNVHLEDEQKTCWQTIQNHSIHFHLRSKMDLSSILIELIGNYLVGAESEHDQMYQNFAKWNCHDYDYSLLFVLESVDECMFFVSTSFQNRRKMNYIERLGKIVEWMIK